MNLHRVAASPAGTRSTSRRRAWSAGVLGAITLLPFAVFEAACAGNSSGAQANAANGPAAPPPPPGYAQQGAPPGYPGQPAYGQPAYGQPAYGQPGQPAYGPAPGYGSAQPGYAQPPPGYPQQPPPGYPGVAPAATAGYPPQPQPSSPPPADSPAPAPGPSGSALPQLAPIDPNSPLQSILSGIASAATALTVPPGTVPTPGDVTDIGLKALSTKVAPGMQPDGPELKQQLSEGQHAVTFVVLDASHCYTIVGFSPIGGVKNLDLNLLSPPFFMTLAGQDLTKNNTPTIGAAPTPMCPIIAQRIEYKLDVFAQAGSGMVAVQLYSKAR